MQPKIEQKRKDETSPSRPLSIQKHPRCRGCSYFRMSLAGRRRLLSHDLNRSTIGAGWLNFRVRYGTGCTPPAKTADPQGTFGICCLNRTLRAAQRVAKRFLRRKLKRRARPISTARLRQLPTLHLQPIKLVVYEWPYQKENSSWDWLPA